MIATPTAAEDIAALDAGAAPVASASEVESEVELRKMRLFFRNAQSAQPMFVLVASILVFHLGGFSPPAWVLIWWLAASLVALLRLNLARRFRIANPGADAIAPWRRQAEAGAMAAGAVWSLGGIGLMLADPGETRLFFALYLSGLASAAVATLSVLPRAFLGFTLPVSLSGAATALLDAHGSNDYLLALAFVLVMLALWRSARYFHDSLDESIRLALRMELLAEQRDAARRASEAAGQALRASEARLSMLLEHDPSAIFLVSPQQRILDVNPQAESLLGRTRSQLLGITMPALLSTREAGRSSGPECRARHQDGHEIVVEMRDVALPDGNRLLALADITERKQAEAELEQYRHHLEALVERRTEALLETTQQAERLARVKGEFLANMSHELRTPLNGVLGFAEMGARRAQAGSREHGYFQNIIKSGGLLHKLINDILDFSRSEEGQLKTELLSYAILDVLKDSLEPLKEKARSRNVALRFSKAPELPERAMGDPYRLKQVLGNLLDNALKFTEQGSVHVSARMDQRHLVFAVRDTGIGIQPEGVAELFQPFTQADTSNTRKYGGAGLGLTLSKRLVELMGGEIRVESEPGQGSLFEFRLPYQAPWEAQAASEPAVLLRRPGGRLRGLNILLVEDNEENRLLLEEVLQFEDCTITLANNGQQAVETVRSRGPGAFQVVLMDVEMPVMNGLDATQGIRALDPGLPVIAQTAYAQPEELDRCMAAGMVDRITKPTDHELLVAKVRKWARRP